MAIPAYAHHGQAQCGIPKNADTKDAGKKYMNKMATAKHKKTAKHEKAKAITANPAFRARILAM